MHPWVEKVIVDEDLIVADEPDVTAARDTWTASVTDIEESSLALSSSGGGGQDSLTQKNVVQVKKRKIMVALVLAGVSGILVMVLRLGWFSEKDYSAYPTFSVTSIPTISNSTIISPYANCEDLRTDLLDAVKVMVDAYLDILTARQYQSTLNLNLMDSRFSSVDRSFRPGSGSVEQSGDQSAESDSFGTNTQEEGTKELDAVKSDGAVAFVAYGPEIVVLEPHNVTVLSRTMIPLIEASSSLSRYDESNCHSKIKGLLLEGEKLVVIAEDMCGSQYHLSFRALVYNVSDPIGPTVLSELPLPGHFVRVSMVGSNVNIFSNLDTRLYDEFFKVADSLTYTYRSTNRLRTHAHEALKGMIPDYVDTLLARVQAAEVSCEGVQRIILPESTQDNKRFSPHFLLGSLGIFSSFSLNALNSVRRSSQFFPSFDWTVYSNQQHLFVAGNGWTTEADSQLHTEEAFVYGFTSTGGQLSMNSFGTVPGKVINKFALDFHEDEDKGFLRVVSTHSELWDRFGPITTRASHLTVFELPSSGYLLKIRGQIQDLGTGEDIYSIRYNNNRCYVVTYLYIDPVHTIDLSDPANPRLTGDLELPGFSNYLHELEGDLLIGIGHYIDEQNFNAGGSRLQISLFDVSDPTAPIRTQNFVEDFESSSAVQFDHRGFRYLDDTNMLILPLKTNDYENDRQFDGFNVYSVDRVHGIHIVLSISHGTEATRCWNKPRLEPRSLVFDGHVLTFKGYRILRNALNSTLVQDDHALDLDADDHLQPCHEYYS